MVYSEALEVMDKGGKVKLPEWQGYWFREASGSLKVLTRTGDILDTPYLDDYQFRKDWEITDGTRDFGGALVALKAGKKVSRKAWNGCYVFNLPSVQVSTDTKDENLNLIASENGGLVTCLPTLRMKTRDNRVLTGWNPNLIEIFAEDWVILN